MPLGFFGTAISFAVIAIAIPWVYALVWPGGVSRTAAFLSVMTVIAIIAAVAAFLWQIAPLKNIGVAASASSSDNGASLDSLLRFRLYVSLVTLLIVQAALSKVVQQFLAR